ncbi:hypothetical protein WH52_13940 [Tenacibaculum holothuriorum]|uniref:Uncharacterized protein n=1 Tax=Tenacibaculum holothuriorum TaxID=1635173 RepID=A0A1Y2P978_9FLAO|nr:hypothetical protein [Tenacibaculum holothuriorum]OSY86996.1 hypothetical protein WH52_13940 [Tenacibaculum holothuriorum]
MKINLSKRKTIKASKVKSQRFLLLPLFFNSSIYWLETVIIKKNFNGKTYQITDVKRLKDLSSD